MAAIEVRSRTTRSARILVSIKDQKPDNIGQYADWGGKEDLAAAPERDAVGPSMLPRNWGRGLGLWWLPAMIVVLSVGLWLRLPAVLIWLSIPALFVGFLLLRRWLDSRRS
jgi:hypothetical protein